MANNVTTTEERRSMGLARANQVCEFCGGHYEKTPNGRWCGAGCLFPQTPVAKGPYSKEERRKRNDA